MPALNWSANCAAQVMFCGELWLGMVPSSSDGASSRIAAKPYTTAGRPSMFAGRDRKIALKDSYLKVD